MAHKEQKVHSMDLKKKKQHLAAKMQRKGGPTKHKVQGISQGKNL